MHDSRCEWPPRNHAAALTDPFHSKALPLDLASPIGQMAVGVAMLWSGDATPVALDRPAHSLNDSGSLSCHRAVRQPKRCATQSLRLSTHYGRRRVETPPGWCQRSARRYRDDGSSSYSVVAETRGARVARVIPEGLQKRTCALVSGEAPSSAANECDIPYIQRLPWASSVWGQPVGTRHTTWRGHGGKRDRRGGKR
jgi:hypothetical protein